MAFMPPRINAERISYPNGCPYFAIDPSGQPQCEVSDVMEEYVPGIHPASLGALCLDSAGNWINCQYFKRAKLL